MLLVLHSLSSFSYESQSVNDFFEEKNVHYLVMHMLAGIIVQPCSRVSGAH